MEEDALAALCNGGEEMGFTPELRGILEMSAQSGKYWHEWRLLKQLIQFRLDQVVKQLHSPGSSENILYDVLNRLGSQLSTFDSAPFTLQRICELLLAAPGGFSSLDKFELAFEKLLLVTSTIPPSQDSYPGTPAHFQVENSTAKHVKHRETNTDNNVNKNDTTDTNMDMNNNTANNTNTTDNMDTHNNTENNMDTNSIEVEHSIEENSKENNEVESTEETVVAS